MRARHEASVLAAALAILTVTTARADIYMDYNGIQGDATAPGFTGAISLDSFSISVSRGISSPSGGSADRESTAPSVSDVLVSGPTGKASPALFNEALEGEGVPVQIAITEPIGKMQAVEYAEWDLNGAMIDHYSTSVVNGVSEDVLSINASSVTYKWFNLDSGGNVLGTESVTVDLGTNRVTTSTTGDVTGFKFVTEVPEPASIGLLLLGTPLLLRRRRAGA
jgi:type VI secretion system secreted protein Hcp